jgi:hypothetical protein
MTTKKHLLNQSNKKNRTFLDKAYNTYISNILDTIDEDKAGRWEIYELIIEEIKKDTKRDYINEVKYRFSDGENHNEVMLEIINRESENINDLVWFLKKRIEEFIDEDYFNEFLK